MTTKKEKAEARDETPEEEQRREDEEDDREGTVYEADPQGADAPHGALDPTGAPPPGQEAAPADAPTPAPTLTPVDRSLVLLVAAIMFTKPGPGSLKEAYQHAKNLIQMLDDDEAADKERAAAAL